MCNNVMYRFQLSLYDISQNRVKHSFLHVSIMKYQFYRGLFLICNHIFGIISLLVQSEVFVQVFSLCHSVDITGQTG